VVAILFFIWPACRGWRCSTGAVLAQPPVRRRAVDAHPAPFIGVAMFVFFLGLVLRFWRANFITANDRCGCAASTG
jgi:hypothetical protein